MRHEGGGASLLQMSTALRGSGRSEVERSASHEPDDELLTLYQVAELLYAHPETVNQWLRRGWRIWASAVDPVGTLLG
jgi:hypothetical protein